MRKIWTRYFLKELAKFFTLFLLCFYFIYVLIDYTAHAKVFQTVALSFKEILFYYGCQFTKRLDLLLPLTLMISTIKVATTAHVQNEILILTTGGLSYKKISIPFIMPALFACLVLYANFQYLQPLTLCKIENFELKHFKGRLEPSPVNNLILEDGSLLIYHHFDTEKKAFCDVFWVKNLDTLLHAQTLFPFEKQIWAEQVDFFEREGEQGITKTSRLDQTSLAMRFTPSSLQEALCPARMQSLIRLGSNLKRAGFGKMNDRAAESAALFYFKLFMPLLCLLAVVAPLPYCLGFKRSIPLFLIYALSLFGLITFFMVNNACLILGSSQIIAPPLALMLPQLILFLIFGWKYAKL